MARPVIRRIVHRVLGIGPHIYRWSDVKDTKTHGGRPRCRICGRTAR